MDVFLSWITLLNLLQQEIYINPLQYEQVFFYPDIQMNSFKGLA